VRFDTEKVATYLKNGAQPTPRVVKLMLAEKIELPAWVKVASKKERATKNVEKLRKNQPKEEAPVAEETPTEEA
jgi:small subunit ribosomal protein S16